MGSVGDMPNIYAAWEISTLKMKRCEDPILSFIVNSSKFFKGSRKYSTHMAFGISKNILFNLTQVSFFFWNLWMWKGKDIFVGNLFFLFMSSFQLIAQKKQEIRKLICSSFLCKKNRNFRSAWLVSPLYVVYCVSSWIPSICLVLVDTR